MNDTAQATESSRDTGVCAAGKPAQAPGPLRGEIGLTVHTRLAQRLIVGRPGALGKPAIIGLFGFADRLRVIWNEAYTDDPYADWWLLKVDQALERAQFLIDREQDSLDALTRSSVLAIGVTASSRPYCLALRFATPYAYCAARLIAAFDNAACAAITARHTGLLVRADAERLLGRCCATLRRLFSVPQSYRILQIDRPAVAAGGAAARHASELMGDLPSVVLTGAQVARWHPGRSASTNTGEERAKRMVREDTQ